MAQHISIEKTGNEKLQKKYLSILKQFNNQKIEKICGSLKCQKIFDDRFKESKNDKVFHTWRTVNNEKECFEIHFDSKDNKVTQIYLVK